MPPTAKRPRRDTPSAAPEPTQAPAQPVAIVAEKPSVARDIARALGADRRGDGYLHGGGWIVTWAIGHLAALAEPHEIDPAWRRWIRSALPILPRAWPLSVYPATKDQFEVVRGILTSPKVARVVCATDAGREGELIFRYIYEAAGCAKPVERLWISSLTPEAISEGFRRLRPAADFDPLADAARARSRADWLVGMNLSRAYSLDYADDFSVGRVQTPTLAMLVERELEIRNFVPEDYIEVVARFDAGEGRVYEGTWFRETDGRRETRLPADGAEAETVVARALAGQGRVASVERKKKVFPPPPLYDLTELQRHANRLYGFRAGKTLELAQKLYEVFKLITYPRTDSRHLSADVAAGLGRVVEAIAGPYRDRLAPGTGERPLGRRFVDDAKVTDHHAIIPTGKRPDGLDPQSDEGRVFDLICRRLLSAWHDDHIQAVTNVVTEVAGGAEPDRFQSSGTAVEQEGWKVLDPPPPSRRGGEQEAATLPGGLVKGLAAAVAEARAERKRTRPPKRFNDATLLTAMETAGKTLDEKELSDAMKERGLGTPATRAAILETLVKRGYAVREGKAMAATDKGVRVIEIVHPKVKSPAMTGEWEARLRAMERGEEAFETFMAGVEEYVREVVGAARPPARMQVDEPPLPDERDAPPPPEDEPPPALPARLADTAQRDRRHATAMDVARAEEEFGRPKRLPLAGPARPSAQPAAPGELGRILAERFGFDRFRPHQEEVCRQVVEGRDVLLVMPTGAGKSLCYQLPGVALGGTALVVSPLIALMEDQVSKLKQQGFRAERIHSGRDRQESRQVCLDYLAGMLDFLFIAPERLKVPGFPEMLAKRKPALVAIDEAHCISQWGHDFRPDYRLLGQRLPLLRPAPVIAVTATATPLVQDDICEQLALDRPVLSIHGFRRDNLAVEVVELNPSQRVPALVNLLSDPSRRPAIIYAPTRKEAERQAADLAGEFAAAAYHAGKTAQQRDQVQAGFLRGHYEAIVATIAFGMGIDKANVRTVVHTGLPGSVESYYQEIGRAGRDGLPSRAVLMHSWSDRRTHEFFIDRDYPNEADLEAIYRKLDGRPRPADELRDAAGLDPAVFDKALEKLWIHGGAVVDSEENVSRGEPDWRAPYLRQREHKVAQLNAMVRLAEGHGCRMLALVEHFGDQEDSRKPCGLCDICQPEESGVRRLRAPDRDEAQAMDSILEALRDRDGQATGRLHRELFDGSDIDRKHFDRLVDGLARAGFVTVREDSFEKDGRTIEFRRVSLTHEGRLQRESVTPHIRLVVEAEIAGKQPRKRAAARSTAKKPAAAKAGSAAKPERAPRPANGEPDALTFAALKAWRLSESKRRHVPAFHILNNRVLTELATALPADEEELLAVKGMGPGLAGKYGAKILSIVANTGRG